MQAFDELLLLKRGGRTIYCGPTGYESQQLVAYFASKKGVDPLPEGTNPASWMLDVRPFHQVHGVLYSWHSAFSLALGLTCAESCCRQGIQDPQCRIALNSLIPQSSIAALQTMSIIRCWPQAAVVALLCHVHSFCGRATCPSAA